MNKIKGTKDWYGIEKQQLDIIASFTRAISEAYDFKMVQFPNIEYTELFSKAVGETTDVVSKEMYTWTDKKDRSISLKPEGTASAVRLVLENKLVELGAEQKISYLERMYRYERPQKGRQREFLQFGVEWFNNPGLEADVEIIHLAHSMLKMFEVKKIELNINTIGNVEERNKYAEALKNYYITKKEKLSPESQRRIEENVLRILDSKEEADIKVNEEAPSLMEYISQEEKDRFKKLLSILDSLDVPYKVNDKLIRGLDYYNGVVFEFISTDIENLGSKATIIGGGRYDKLISNFDPKKDVPAIGFAVGIERLILATKDWLSEIEEDAPMVAVLTENEDQLQRGILYTSILRDKGYTVRLDAKSRKLSKKIEKADKDGIEYVAILKDDLKEPHVKLKNLITKEEIEININDIQFEEE